MLIYYFSALDYLRIYFNKYLLCSTTETQPVSQCHVPVLKNIIFIKRYCNDSSLFLCSIQQIRDDIVNGIHS